MKPALRATATSCRPASSEISLHGGASFEIEKLRPEPPFTGVSGPSGPEIAKKISKRVFWGAAEKKVPKNTRQSPKNTPKSPKIGILGFVRVFFGTFLQTPQKTLFETVFFAISGPEGRRLL